MLLVVLGAALLGGACAAELLAQNAAKGPLTWTEAYARIVFLNHYAKNRGDDDLVNRLREVARQAKQWIDAGNPYKADELIARVEVAAGLDPGGKTMGGAPFFRGTPQMVDQFEKLEPKLDAAMKEKDKYTIVQVITAMKRILGDQAGLPAAANAGWRPAGAFDLEQADAVDLFLAAMESERKKINQISTGNPIPDTRVRYYAELVIACSEIRDRVKAHRPRSAAELDKVVAGACTILMMLQQPSGHFPTPDPKNKLRWVMTVDADGQTQFDTGEAGVALLLAGVEYAKSEWLAAGLKAADWAATQPCVHNYSYNAQSIYVLAAAHRITRNKKYLSAALEKYDLGVLPGQLPGGRWLDPHNARTPNHLINVRALSELLLALPERMNERVDHRAILHNAVQLATKAVIDEFERLGVTNTSYALPALWRVQKFDAETDQRLAATIRRAAAATVMACSRDGKKTFAASPAALAMVARVAQ